MLEKDIFTDRKIRRGGCVLSFYTVHTFVNSKIIFTAWAHFTYRGFMMTCADAWGPMLHTWWRVGLRARAHQVSSVRGVRALLKGASALSLGRPALLQPPEHASFLVLCISGWFLCWWPFHFLIKPWMPITHLLNTFIILFLEDQTETKPKKKTSVCICFGQWKFLPAFCTLLQQSDRMLFPQQTEKRPDCGAFFASAEARPRAVVRSLSEELNAFPDSLPAEKWDTAECGKYAVISVLCLCWPLSCSALQGEMDRKVRPLGRRWRTEPCASLRSKHSPPTPTPTPSNFQTCANSPQGAPRLCVYVCVCLSVHVKGGLGRRGCWLRSWVAH